MNRINGSKYVVLNAILLAILLARISLVRFQKKSASFSSSAEEESSRGSFPKHLYYDSLGERYASYPCMPKRIHLAQADNVDAKNETVSMTVSFSLDFENCATVRPTVVYGRRFRPEGSMTTEPLQFNYSSTESNGLYRSDWIYHVQLPDLKASETKYWYKILVQHDNDKAQQETVVFRERQLRGSSNLVGETPMVTFQTPPLQGMPTTLALVGDIGQTEHSIQTLAHIWRAATHSPYHENHVSQLLIAGDLSYADSEPTRWTRWMELIEPLLRSTPLSVAAGNHEIECDNRTGDIFVPYEYWFRNPHRIRDAETLPVTEDYRKTLWHESCSAPSEFQGHYHYGNSFYTYQHGLLQIIVLNSYTNATVGSVQYQWLEQELKAINRSETPWVLVMFHAPLYTTFRGHVNELEALNMKKAMEPLFIKYGVNLIVSGHDHALMRTHPLAFGQVDPTGAAPIYLTLGAGGNREGHAPGYRNEEPEPWVVERRNDEYGYGHLFVPNATHALFQWIRDGVPVYSSPEEKETWIYNPHYVDSFAQY